MISDDLTLEKIDFEWVNSQTKVAPLKKALKLLELDGNYYTDLIKAVEEKLVSIDPKYTKTSEVVIDPVVKKQAQIDVEKWAENPTLEKNKRLAEQEKNKGNEALKSNDFKEAINYYTQSIQFDRQMAPSYCNRALVYLKLKDYQNVITDCDYAIALQPDYTKAYHRRGKAYFALKQYDKAYLDFKFILQVEPDNNEVNGELRECRKFLTEQQINSAENKQFIEKQGGFKKVQIVEEDEEEEEIPISKQKQPDFSKEYDEIMSKKNEITNRIQKGAYSQSIVELIELLKENQKYIDQHRFVELRAVLLSNLAYCHLQLQEYQKVIEYCGNILEDNIAWDIKTKAYLRRGMAYERLDKVVLSKLDFLRVKDLDPGNQQASQALHRLSKIMSQEENNKAAKIREEEQNKQEIGQQSRKVEQPIQKKKEEPQSNQQQPVTTKKPIQEVDEGQKLQLSDAEISIQLGKLKEQGNGHYKAQEIEKAIQVWGEGIKFYEANPAPSQIHLYYQLLTNSCLCLSQLNSNNQVIELASKVLVKDQNNQKALYRRGVAYATLAQASQKLEEQNELFENGRKDLERLVYLDSENKQAKEKLLEVQKQHAECRVKLKKNQESQPRQDKKDEQNNSQQEKTEQQQAKGQQPKQKSVNQQQIDQIGQNLTVNVIQDLLNKKQLPETATIFEKNMNTFKKATPSQIIDYVFQVDNLQQLYSKKDLPTDILFLIINAGLALKQDNSYNEKLTTILRDRLPKTHKFDLCVNMFTKKEKALIKELLECHSLNDLFSIYQIK
ncbi:unnamed protein product (macronuclear) [Paramecium tetraurelia]|uniref:RNA-polymerase II-associated protein 3-like C-terminal domain-containing protein n=1 Tax=Paramecium tetraurelia TaxID=5888 RepID=A0BW60_PARTE|nr:uncharacterized protein GSPATT00032629001 [Paramecium tetraurelia]CAK62777.1 unnamed protein product [Paramecium tetraurelia]|eukprot:XP_001430175.1 hypothetical protein (macronuclear) [Paramecium tetraurelia strain d4-2]